MTEVVAAVVSTFAALVVFLRCIVIVTRMHARSLPDATKAALVALLGCAAVWEIATMSSETWTDAIAWAALAASLRHP